jgi:hypothetical protein
MYIHIYICVYIGPMAYLPKLDAFVTTNYACIYMCIYIYIHIDTYV